MYLVFIYGHRTNSIVYETTYKYTYNIYFSLQWKVGKFYGARHYVDVVYPREYSTRKTWRQKFEFRTLLMLRGNGFPSWSFALRRTAKMLCSRLVPGAFHLSWKRRSAQFIYEMEPTEVSQSLKLGPNGLLFESNAGGRPFRSKWKCLSYKASRESVTYKCFSFILDF